MPPVPNAITNKPRIANALSLIGIERESWLLLMNWFPTYKLMLLAFSKGMAETDIVMFPRQ